MRKVKIHLLDIGYAKKPEGREYARINNNITKKVSEIDIGTFAEEVGTNGRPFTPAIFNGQRKKMILHRNRYTHWTLTMVSQWMSSWPGQRDTRSCLHLSMLHITIQKICHGSGLSSSMTFPSGMGTQPPSSSASCIRYSPRQIKIVGMSAGSI